MSSRKKILILNGPNLNLLGIRDQSIYGTLTLDEIIQALKDAFKEHSIIHYQSKHEGELIDLLHKYGFEADGIILNAGAYTHTSIAIADAVRAIRSPVVELHISDIYARESYRHSSYLKECCQHHVIGKGTGGYAEAVKYLIEN